MSKAAKLSRLSLSKCRGNFATDLTMARRVLAGEVMPWHAEYQHHKPEKKTARSLVSRPSKRIKP